MVDGLALIRRVGASLVLARVPGKKILVSDVYLKLKSIYFDNANEKL